MDIAVEKKTCLQPGCDRAPTCRGVCASHYARMYAGHIPDLRLPPLPREERVAKVLAGRKKWASQYGSHKSKPIDSVQELRPLNGKSIKPDKILTPKEPSPSTVIFSLDGKRSVILFAEKLIRMLEIRASETKDSKVMAGYLGAMQSTKLLALTVDPCALQELSNELDDALKRMKKKLQP